MKKRIILALTVVFALGLAMAVYALNQPETATHDKKANCCQKSDSCPMKNKDAKSAEKASCCDKADCCCNGGSCPMKNKKEMASMDNCPMKNKSETKSTTVSTADMQNVTVADGGENCCGSCDCCKGGDCCKGKKN